MSNDRIAPATGKPVLLDSAGQPIPTDARCLSCGYRLLGLPEARCPECGREFDPADPWTIRLPRRPSGLTRWLAQPPTKIGRALPVAAVLVAAWGTRLPGWESGALRLAAILMGSCLLSSVTWGTALRVLARRDYPLGSTREIFHHWRRRMLWTMFLILVLLVLRPTMLISFWLSRPAFDQVARSVLAQPFSQTPRGGSGIVGIYYVDGVRRCPHGVKAFVTDGPTRGTPYLRDLGPGFFFRESPDRCVRFAASFPLGGGWYLSP